MAISDRSTIWLNALLFLKYSQDQRECEATNCIGGCVTTHRVICPAARGIRIERLSTTLLGILELQGLLAVDDTVTVVAD